MLFFLNVSVFKKINKIIYNKIQFIKKEEKNQWTIKKSHVNWKQELRKQNAKETRLKKVMEEMKQSIDITEKFLKLGWELVKDKLAQHQQC
ncbi:hypothetical protein pb186bvf_013308 [Paramecium bursaria]